MNDEPDQSPITVPGAPVPGPALVLGLIVSAAGMLGAASLGWAGVPILVALFAADCAVLLRWAR